MPTPIGCYCNDSKWDILVRIFQQDRATAVRLAQLTQVFGGTPSAVPDVNDNCFCGDTRMELLELILEQRRSNFNRLQEVIEAA